MVLHFKFGRLKRGELKERIGNITNFSKTLERGQIKMFDNLKRKIQERIEKDAIKVSDLSYKDINGNIVSEDIVVKKSRFPLIGDWGRIYPAVNEDGSWNYINLLFGGKKNLIKLLVVLGVVGMFFLAFYEIFSQWVALKDSCIIFIP